MIRIRCEDCGAWHSGELAFCPYCDTMHAGGLSGNESIAVYEKATSRFASQLVGSLLYRRNLAQWLDWAGSLVGDAMGLLLEPAWIPCWYAERTSFAPVEVDKLFGLDFSRLASVDRRFERLGFSRNLDFTIPEEHQQCLYRLYLLPGESTWALVRIPSPSALRAGRWELGFHSRLKTGAALVTQPMALAGPTPEGKIEFLFGSPRPEDLYGLHRQETFRRGGALPVRGRPRPGSFFRHYALVTRLTISHRVGLGLLKRGKGPAVARHSLVSPWAGAIGSCAHCLCPVTENEGVRVRRGLLCAQCWDEPRSQPRRVFIPLWRRGLAGLSEVGLSLLVAGLLTLAWKGRLDWACAVLLWPMCKLGFDLFPLGKFLFGLRLQDEQGGSVSVFRRLVRAVAWWASLGLGWLPVLWQQPAWHDRVAGTGVGPRP